MGVLHWIVAGAAIFTVTAIFVPFLIVVTDTLVPIMINSSNDMGSTDAIPVINNINNVFIIAPIIMVIVIILWALFASERREFDSRRERLPI